jgi:hypothetical protein
LDKGCLCDYGKQGVVRAAPLLEILRMQNLVLVGERGYYSQGRGGRVRRAGENEIKYLPGLPAQSRQARGTRPPMQLWSDMLAAILQ